MILAANFERQAPPGVGSFAPTNSAANGPDFDAERLGSIPLIDTIRVRGRITAHHLPPDRMRAQVDGNGTLLMGGFTGRTRLDGGGTLSLDRHGGGTWASVEASLPNRQRGHNLVATALADLRPLLLNMIDESEQHVTWSSRDPDSLQVARLDLVRDFHGVNHLDHLLTGLRRVAVPRTQSAQLFSDHLSGGALTLLRQVPRAWRTSLYGKHAQVRHLAGREHDPMRREWLYAKAEQARDQVRFEAQLRLPALRRQGITSVSDLKAETAVAARQHYFERVRFGEAVGGAPRLTEVGEHLWQSSNPDYKFFGSVVGTLLAEANGWPSPHSANTTKRNYTLARQWGISAADMTSVGSDPVMLDLASGTLRAAA